MRIIGKAARLGAAMLGLTAPGAFAADIVDQEQLMTTPTPVFIGGGSEQKLAQSFTVGVTGFLTEIRLPVACSSGELIVEIQRVDANGDPSGVVVSRANIQAEDLPPPPDDFVSISLSPQAVVNAGEQYAIVLSNPTGTCGMLSAPEGDTYPGGKYFYDARPNPPGWVGGKGRPAPMSTPGDMPFQTVVDDGVGSGGSANRCFGNVGGGPVPLPINEDLPICRCLEDPGLNEFRCRLLHPDFFITRRIPLPPLEAGGAVVEEWAFTPLTKLDGPVRMSLEVGGKPQVYEFGKKSKPGDFETLRLKRSLKDPGLLKPGLVEFDYPMKGADSLFQQEFGFDPSFETGEKQ